MINVTVNTNSFDWSTPQFPNWVLRFLYKRDRYPFYGLQLQRRISDFETSLPNKFRWIFFQMRLQGLRLQSNIESPDLIDFDILNSLKYLIFVQHLKLHIKVALETAKCLNLFLKMLWELLRVWLAGYSKEFQLHWNIANTWMSGCWRLVVLSP